MIWLPELKYVRVYNIEIKEKYVQARLQTSEKKQTGEYENSDWYARFVGGSLGLAQQLTDKSTITINQGKLTNPYNRDTKKAYLNMTVFDFEITKQGEKKESVQSESFDEDDFSSFKTLDDGEDVPW